MNKVILMGRLTRDPEVRYSQGAEPVAVVRFSIAVNRRFKREGDPDADFFNCVAFGKTGEFTNRYFKKGNMISIVGRLSTSSWNDAQSGQKRYATEIIVEEQFFCESKASADASRASYTPPVQADEATNATQPPQQAESFYKVEQSVDDDDLPF